MGNKGKVLKDYEAAVARVAMLEAEVQRAKADRDRLRRTVLAQMSDVPRDLPDQPNIALVQHRDPPEYLQSVVRSFGDDEVLTPEDLARRLTLDVKTARNRLHRAVERGLVRREGRGRYVLVRAQEPEVPSETEGAVGEDQT